MKDWYLDMRQLLKEIEIDLWELKVMRVYTGRHYSTPSSFIDFILK